MGVVYEAEQISLGRRVALKVLPRQVSSDRMVRERFRREARAAARLHHTNIVPVYEVGQDGDVRFYAMQFIQGQGLDLVITELRRLRDGAGPSPRSGRPSTASLSGPAASDSRQAIDAPPLGEGVELSAVLRSILGGRFDPGGRRPERVEASRSIWPGPRRRPHDTGRHRDRKVERPDPTPHWRAPRSRVRQPATQTGQNRRIRPNQPCQRPPPRRQARRSCPGAPSSRRSSRVGGRSSAAWRTSAGRSPGAWPTPTRGGSCTGTSSRRTCCWTPKAWSGSRISAWPRGTTRG